MCEWKYTPDAPSLSSKIQTENCFPTSREDFQSISFTHRYQWEIECERYVYSWIWFYAMKIILELNNWRVLFTISRLGGWVIATSFTRHHMQFQWFCAKAIHGGSTENVGNAKLESEKLIQQVFIMHACEILVFNSKICIFTQPTVVLHAAAKFIRGRFRVIF